MYNSKAMVLGSLSPWVNVTTRNLDPLHGN